MILYIFVILLLMTVFEINQVKLFNNNNFFKQPTSIDENTTYFRLALRKKALQ